MLEHISNGDWTLFLDRDGTINQRIINGYVGKWEEFKWIDGAIQALGILAKYFRRIIIITNQQGIAKGLMTEEDLSSVHEIMTTQCREIGVEIDAIYYCPKSRSDKSNNRKPKPNMGLLAQKDFPEIAFSETIMIGDMQSDIDFGVALGAKTLSLLPDNTNADFYIPSIEKFARDLSDYAIS